MKDHLTDRDWELLSAYADGIISPEAKRIVESRLASDVDLQEAYRSLIRVRGILHEIPPVKRRRNFFLKADMVRMPGWSWIIPVVNFGSAATGLLAVLLFVLQLFPMAARPALMAPAAQEKQSAPVIQTMDLVPDELEEYPAAELDMAAPAPAAPESAVAGAADGESAIAIPEIAEAAPPMPLEDGHGAVIQPEKEAFLSTVPQIQQTTPTISTAYGTSEETASTALPQQEINRIAIPSMTVEPALNTGTEEKSLETGGTSPGMMVTQTLPVQNTPSLMPETLTDPQVTKGTQATEFQWSGLLLLVSSVLAITGFYLKRRQYK